MAEVSRLQVETALKEYVDPYLEKDLASAGSIKDITVDGGKIKLDVVLGFPAKGFHAELAAKLKEKVSAIAGVSDVTVNVSTNIVAHSVQKGVEPIKGIKNIVDASVQLTGDDRGMGYAYRAHVGAVSTHVPGHTLSLDYYLNLAENPADTASFTSHDVTVAVTSVVIPWTTIAARYNVNLQEGFGDQFLQSGTLSATVTPGSPLSATV